MSPSRLWLVVGFLVGGCAGNLSELRVQHYGLEAQLAEVKAKGGEECAPIALATAEAAWKFAGVEFQEGDVARAEQHLNDGKTYLGVALAALKECRPMGAQAVNIVLPGEGAGSSTDSDGDGLVDDADKCPSKPEDRDGYQDDDGCPDNDNDGDGFADGQDPCPMKAEDRDNYQDQDGCPDEDNDGDNIPDAKDNCVNAAETYNSYADNDGCPDLAPKFIRIEGNKILQSSKVGFEGRSTRLFGDTYRVLNEVAAYMNDYNGVRIQIEGHTDNQGISSENQKLSLQMAEAVKAYLMDQGVEENRLEVVGRGGNMPVDTNRTQAGRDKNNRVEFYILSLGN